MKPPGRGFHPDEHKTVNIVENRRPIGQTGQKVWQEWATYAHLFWLSGYGSIALIPTECLALWPDLVADTLAYRGHAEHQRQPESLEYLFLSLAAVVQTTLASKKPNPDFLYPRAQKNFEKFLIKKSRNITSIRYSWNGRCFKPRAKYSIIYYFSEFVNNLLLPFTHTRSYTTPSN